MNKSGWLLLWSFLASVGLSNACSSKIANDAPSKKFQHLANASESVVMLVIDGQFICSGSVVTDSLILTAAHCANGFSTLEFLDKQEVVHASSTFHIHDQYQYSPNNDFIAFDLALIEFEKGTLVGYTPLIIDFETSRVKGLSVAMAGWGDNEYFVANGKIESRGGGQLRLGKNSINSFKSTLIETVGMHAEGLGLIPDESQASLSGGDSGGALFNEDSQLIGVSSAGQLFNDNGVPKVSSLFVDLAADSSREFLLKHVE